MVLGYVAVVLLFVLLLRLSRVRVHFCTSLVCKSSSLGVYHLRTYMNGARSIEQWTSVFYVYVGDFANASQTFQCSATHCRSRVRAA